MTSTFPAASSFFKHERPKMFLKSAVNVVQFNIFPPKICLSVCQPGNLSSAINVVCCVDSVEIQIKIYKSWCTANMWNTRLPFLSDEGPSLETLNLVFRLSLVQYTNLFIFQFVCPCVCLPTRLSPSLNSL